MKVMAVNISPKTGNKKRNIKKMEKFIDKEDADLYIFGEMSLTGYMCRDEIFKLAERIDGESVGKIKEIAEQKDAYIIFGMPLKEKDGIIYNAAIVAKPDGIGVYTKNYLANFGPFEEKLYFNSGNDISIVKTRFGNIGLCICYDIFFPELIKAMALNGADIIACISASPSTSRNYFERVFPARAIENTSFLIYSNLAGEEENLVFWGGSQIYDPMGNLMGKAEYFKEDYILQDIDLNLLQDARIARPTLRDTKSEIFFDLYNISRRKNVFSRDVKLGIRMGEMAEGKWREIEVYGNDEIAFGIKLATGCRNVRVNESNEIKAIFRGENEIEITGNQVKGI